MRTIHVSTILIILLAFVFASSVRAQERRRWSPQAKGTVIGAGVGGAAGAIINKRNRAVGGIIGGLAGGAVGYGVGKSVDNRRKTNARIDAAERRAANAQREAQLARQEAQLARQEAASGRSGRSEPTLTNRPATVKGQAAVTGIGVSTVQPSVAFSLRPVSPTSTGNALFLANTSYGNPVSAYPASEVRRKSW